MARLDLSGLDAFKATAVLEDATGKPLELPLDAIDFDPLQPRRQVLAETVAELAQTIKTDGVLQPISVRPHPEHKGRYVINHGERRVRAARLAGITTIPGFVSEAVDPYAQAIENLQREDLLPLDLATFVWGREQAGDSRAEIARRLGKPRSFISEVAVLAQAPAVVRELHDAGRCRDVHALYLLVRAHREQPQAVETLAAESGALTRERVEAFATREAVVHAKAHASQPSRERTRSVIGSGNALMVEFDGQQATLDLTSHPSTTTASVRLADGSLCTVELNRLHLIAWTEGSS